ncbi:hypothetical protein EVAR_101283_1 [Eumeta japonica]|uniref:Uncharacterized protein n=1 Tax=Eumeta variegata TaxID=151549 RepID=A0A4C1SGE6_EUMVA|nr:hypothetical protein EVAR_101283_1 [Eumeta japonica]
MYMKRFVLSTAEAYFPAIFFQFPVHATSPHRWFAGDLIAGGRLQRPFDAYWNQPPLRSGSIKLLSIAKVKDFLASDQAWLVLRSDFATWIVFTKLKRPTNALRQPAACGSCQ